MVLREVALHRVIEKKKRVAQIRSTPARKIELSLNNPYLEQQGQRMVLLDRLAREKDDIAVGNGMKALHS
jgi:hypothetical protein